MMMVMICTSIEDCDRYALVSVLVFYIYFFISSLLSLFYSRGSWGLERGTELPKFILPGSC